MSHNICGDIMTQVPLGKNYCLYDPNLNLLRDIKIKYDILIKNYRDLEQNFLNRLADQQADWQFSIGLTGCFWFLYGTLVDGAPTTILINRQDRKHYRLNMNFQMEFFKGTLVSGEVAGKYFFIQDILILNDDGRYYTKHDLNARIAQAHVIFNEWLFPEPTIDCLEFVLKNYFKLDLLHLYTNFNSEVETLTGNFIWKQIIFTPNHFDRFPNSLIYRVKTNELQSTLTSIHSPPEVRPMMLTSRKDQPDVYDVTDVNGNRHGLAHIQTAECSRHIRQKHDQESTLTMLCAFDKSVGKWCPIKNHS